MAQPLSGILVASWQNHMMALKGYAENGHVTHSVAFHWSDHVAKLNVNGVESSHREGQWMF